MYKEKEVFDTVKNAFAGMLPDYEECTLLPIINEIDIEELAQGLNYYAEEVFTYETHDTFEIAIQYRGPELFDWKACLVLQYPIMQSSTYVDQEIIRELWLLEDMSFVEISKVTVAFTDENNKFESMYRTIRHEVKGERVGGL